MDKRIDWRALRSRAVQRLALELASVACACSGEGHARPVTTMGLRFPSPVGIAAGFDRYGRLARRVAALGFGFNEIGSLTANEVAQLGVMHNGAARLGISLTLDARQASAESRAMLRAAWPHADYLMLNLIGPTSAPLLSQSTRLRHLLAALVDEQRQLNQDGRRRVPLLAKLRCMPERTPFSIAGLLVELGFDGLLAAHDPGPPATAERYRAWQDPRRQAHACQQIEELRRFCGPDMALLSVGGVQTADHLRARMSAGAELVQVHTAFMHQSPWLARRLLR